MDIKSVAGPLRGGQTARMIDHTVLASDADENKVADLCDEALRFGFHSVFLQPCRVEQASRLLKGSDISVGSVAGFPFGAALTETKSGEAAAVVENGATEVEMVINIGWIKDGSWDLVGADIENVNRAARSAGDGVSIVIKVIIETCLLTEAEKIKAALVIKEAGADFVKTSTGYMEAGAIAADVALIRRTVGPDFGVKASGGIRTAADLAEMISAGADRIGTSAGVAIMGELESDV